MYYVSSSDRCVHTRPHLHKQPSEEIYHSKRFLPDSGNLFLPCSPSLGNRFSCHQKHICLLPIFMYSLELLLLLLLFSHPVVSDSLRPQGLQHTRLPCPSLSPRVYYTKSYSRYSSSSGSFTQYNRFNPVAVYIRSLALCITILSSVPFFFFLRFILFLAVLGLHCCPWAFISCGAWASHCSDFSCCKAQTLGAQASVGVAPRL